MRRRQTYNFPGCRPFSVSHRKLGKRQETEQQEVILLAEEFDQEARLEVSDSHWYCPIIKLAQLNQGRPSFLGSLNFDDKL